MSYDLYILDKYKQKAWDRCDIKTYFQMVDSKLYFTDKAIEKFLEVMDNRHRDLYELMSIDKEELYYCRISDLNGLKKMCYNDEFRKIIHIKIINSYYRLHRIIQNKEV